jgi:hypothetical protein
MAIASGLDQLDRGTGNVPIIGIGDLSQCA